MRKGVLFGNIETVIGFFARASQKVAELSLRKGIHIKLLWPWKEGNLPCGYKRKSSSSFPPPPSVVVFAFSIFRRGTDNYWKKGERDYVDRGKQNLKLDGSEFNSQLPTSLIPPPTAPQRNPPSQFSIRTRRSFKSRLQKFSLLTAGDKFALKVTFSGYCWGAITVETSASF